VFPQPPPPTKPEQTPGIPVGDTGWTLQFIRGYGWVLIPPEEPPPAAGPKK
jgi:hypothetical protein